MKYNKTKKSVIILLLIILAGSFGLASAEEAAKPAPVDVSGLLFFDYSYLIESKDNEDDSKNLEKQHSFNLTRAYFKFNKKIDDMWSAKVTLDAGTYSNTVNTTASTDNKDNNKGSYTFLKNAYGQFTKKSDTAGLKVQGGLVGTPVIGLLDGLVGSRWIYQNYIDKAKDITGGSIDVGSADTGLKADLNILKTVNITGMYSNGDGYKTNTTDQNTITKAYYGVANITIINALNIFGYYHWHDTDKNSKENFASYIGGGAAWSQKAIRLGAAYTLRNGKAADVKEESGIMEAWVNVNLEQFTNVPVLLIGRYATGTYEKNASSKLENNGSAIWCGVGYQVNNNVQFALMYKAGSLTKKSGGVKTSDVENSTMFVKSEIKF